MNDWSVKRSRVNAYFLCVALLALFFLPGCAPAPPEKVVDGPALEVVPESDWPVLLDDMDALSLVQACRHSLAYLERISPQKRFSYGSFDVNAAQMAQALRELQYILVKEPNPEARTQALKKRFMLLRSRGSDGRGAVLFTGYYEPVLKARKEPAPPYIHPLFSVPQDMLTINLRDFSPKLPQRRLVGRVQGKKVIPYHDRAEIDYQGALAGKAEPLAYVANLIDAFFLHIQGSGQVVFEDGSRLRLGYAASNGHPYRSIGKLLISEGLMDLENMSMQAINKFLSQRPAELRRVLSHNPSYVFFRPLKPEGGPLGCYATELTPGRSIATDRRIFPGLAMAYIKGEGPTPEGGLGPLNRFVLNQDTGGAIRGPGRLDLYYGSGKEAGELAGRMKYQGQLFFLAPKPN